MENILKMRGVHVSQTRATAGAVIALDVGESSSRHGFDLVGLEEDAPARLTSAKPSRLLNVADVLELAMYVFGDLSTAEAWMQESQGSLCGNPAQLCQRPGGLDIVLQLLYAIAGGTEP